MLLALASLRERGSLTNWLIHAACHATVALGSFALTVDT